MDKRSKKVMILDDESIIRYSLADFFEDRLWKTQLAESGEEALELLEKEEPDGIIVDIRLNGIDGIKFIQEALRRGHYIAYIICSGSPELIIPDKVLEEPCVSRLLFKKPVVDMADIEQELLRLITYLEGNEKI